MDNKLFICFAAEDRYRVAEPIVYHLKNYGINIWYDRYSLLLGDNRIQKNLIQGASRCEYVVAIISQFTTESPCAMEELQIIRDRYYKNEVIVFPILYEISPSSLSNEMLWLKELIFKEVDRQSGTYEICNHIACKLTDNYLHKCAYKNIKSITIFLSDILPPATYIILKRYQDIDSSNLNSKIAMLYAAYITIKVLIEPIENPTISMVFAVFERLFSETKLNLDIDYRELWLLENSICILVNMYLAHCIESKI